MTTKNSPEKKIRAQARKIVSTLKSSHFGDKKEIKVGIVMDDKSIFIDIPVAAIKSSNKKELVEFIFLQMAEKEVH